MESTKSRNYTLLPQGEVDPLTISHTQRPRWSRKIWQWFVPLILAAIVITTLIVTHTTGQNDTPSIPFQGKTCPQFPLLKVLSSERRKLGEEVKEELSSESFFRKSVKRMQGAVQIPTESFEYVSADHNWLSVSQFTTTWSVTFPAANYRIVIWGKLERINDGKFSCHSRNTSKKPFPLCTLPMYILLGQVLTSFFLQLFEARYKSYKHLRNPHRMEGKQRITKAICVHGSSRCCSRAKGDRIKMEISTVFSSFR